MDRNALDASNPNGPTLRIPMGKTRQERVIPVEAQTAELVLRHTFATEMARAGMNLQVLMRILSHENPSMTMRHVQVAATDLRRHYDQALDQLKLLNHLNPPLVPQPSSNPNLPHLVEIPITALDSKRRDTQDPRLILRLQRLTKRIRKVRDDLHNLL